MKPEQFERAKVLEEASKHVDRMISCAKNEDKSKLNITCHLKFDNGDSQFPIFEDIEAMAVQFILDKLQVKKENIQSEFKSL